MSNLIPKLPDSSKEKDVKSDGKVHILKPLYLTQSKKSAWMFCFLPTQFKQVWLQVMDY